MCISLCVDTGVGHSETDPLSHRGFGDRQLEFGMVMYVSSRILRKGNHQVQPTRPATVEEART